MDRPDPATSGGGPGGRHIVLGRAIAVIVAAVVLGVLILHEGFRSPVVALPTTSVPSTGSTGSTGSTSTSPTQPGAGATSSTVSHAAVKVLVANDSTTPHVAAGYTTALRNAGWTLLTPANARPPILAKSAVYYAVNKQSEAEAVAAALGLAPGAVLPISPATPVSNTAGADVVVVIGADLAAKTPPSTVPTTTVPKTTTTRAHTASTAG